MSALLRQQMLMMAQAVAAAPGITPLAASQLNTRFNDGVPNNVPIPPGSQAGDAILLAGQATVTNATFSVTPPSGSATPLVPTQYYTLGSAIFFAFGYLYALTATDITNGTVPLTVTASAGGSVVVAALSMRNAQAEIDGSVGQLLQSTLQTLPVSMGAPGIRTTVDGDLLVSFEAVSTASSDASSPFVFAAPSGFTHALDTYAQSQAPVSLSYQRQGTAGATGNATGTLSCTDGSATSTAFGAWLFAVKAKSTTPAAGTVSWVNGASYETGVSGSMPLPTGVQAGDYLLIMTNAGSNNVFTLANSSPIVAPTSYYGNPTQSQPVAALYSYRVTATDAANGSIPLTYPNRFEVGAWRGVSTSDPIDAQSAFTIGPFSNPVVLTIPGITTLTDGAMLAFLGAVHTAVSVAAATMTQPTGYDGRIAEQNNSNSGLLLATKAQSSAGPTGDCTGASFDNNEFGNFAGILIALKPGT